jgi:hypothetical protein
MPPTVLSTFVGPAYQSQSVNADCEILMNQYVEAMESPGAKVPAVVYDCPGFTQLQTLSPGPIRASFAQNGREFYVSGFNFYETFPDNTHILRGTVAVNANPATIASNGDGGDQLFLTSGDTGYCYDLTANTLTPVLTSGATMCDFLNGYILVLDATNSLFQWSNFEDCSTFAPLNYAQRTLGSDKWVAMRVVYSTIWLLGSQTSEAWALTGAFPLPFAPVPGAFLEQGCAAPFSLIDINNTLVWISQNNQGTGMIQRLDGYAPVRWSNHAIEEQIQSYVTISDALGFSYQQDGHTFGVFTFPTAAKTWVGDAATNYFHARGRWNPLTSRYDAYRVGYPCSPGNNLVHVGDLVTGDIYSMSPLVATEVDGAGIRRQRRFLIPSDTQNYKFISNLQLYGQSGVGLSSGQGSDPQIQVSVSKDGGHRFGPTKWLPLGKQGEYDRRTLWRGTVMRARNPVIDVVCSDPVPTRWISATADIEVGSW